MLVVRGLLKLLHRNRHGEVTYSGFWRPTAFTGTRDLDIDQFSSLHALQPIASPAPALPEPRRTLGPHSLEMEELSEIQRLKMVIGPSC